MNRIFQIIRSPRLRRSLRNSSLALASISVLGLVASSVSANDWGRCGGRYSYDVHRYRNYDHGYYGQHQNVYRAYGSNYGAGACATPRVDFYPVLDCQTVGWAYQCGLDAFGCRAFYHPQYECWYYFYPQQNVFLPVQYIQQYPPVAQGNLNQNVNDNLNHNRNDNQNANSNVTNINIGVESLPTPNPNGGDAGPQFIPGNPVPGNQPNGGQIPQLPELPQAPAGGLPPLPDLGNQQ